MSTKTSWTRPRPSTPFPKRLADIQDSDDYASSSSPPSGEDEEKHTFSGYGVLPSGDVILPSSTSPGSPSPLQSRFPQSRPLLRLRRPRPRHRTTYSYFRDPLPLAKGLDSYDPSPGSAIVPNHRHHHQPLVSPRHIASSGSRTSNENMSVNNSGSSIERLVDELLPSSPSVRFKLSPPGSPQLSRESHDHQNGAQNPPPAPALISVPPKKPKPALWRTRLPPRPPIPKWDI